MTQIYRIAAAIVALSGTAVAADLPIIKGPPTFASAGTNWSGFYGGLNWGLASGTTQWRNPTGWFALPPTDVPATGRHGGLNFGAQFGYNYQTGAVVLGVGADVNAGRLVGYATCRATLGVGGSGDTCGNKVDLMASLTGRFGYAVGRALFYAKGGAAYMRERAEVSNFVLGPIPPASSTASRMGWTIGGGLEYAISNNWSAFSEYGYYNFGSRTYSMIALTPGPVPSSIRVSNATHLVKFGLNYRFGGNTADTSAANPQIANDISGEFGTRVGWSTGKYRFDLFEPENPAQMNSRLTWPGQAGMSLEGFARLDHVSGFFAKGFVGGLGLYKSGHMNDEDFPPAAVPYSNTVSSTKNGNGLYGTVDLGYTFIKGNALRLGAFVGYNHYQAQYHAYGCTQIAGNVDMCGPGAVPAAALTLSRRETWDGVRLGLAADYLVTDRLKLSADAAWLPYVAYSGFDNHWLRPDINPIRDNSGKGNNGFQIEGIASYKVTDSLSLGIGARYWSMTAKGNVQFPEAIPPNPTKVRTERATVFLQAAYEFGGSQAAPVVAKY